MTEVDATLVALARATRQRAGSEAGAALRDASGRTYAGASVTFIDPALSVSALRVAVLLALASGSRTYESAVVVGDEVAADGTAALAELSPGCPVTLLPA